MGETPIEKRIETDPALAAAVNETVPAVGGGGRAPTRHERGRRTEALEKRSHKKKARSAGVGESRPFVAAPGAFEETRDWSQLTINGLPIPQHMWTLTPYRLTDQGHAEFNAGKQSRSVEVLREAPLGSRSTEDLTRFKSEQSIESSVAQFRESLELMEQEDPLGVLMARHLPAGRRGLWLSERNVSSVGLRRGVLDYEPVLDENGQRITHGKMFLASVPEEAAVKAEGYYLKKSKQQLQSAVATVRNQAEAITSEAGVKRIQQRGDLPDAGIEFLDGSDGGGMLPGDFGHQFNG